MAIPTIEVLPPPPLSSDNADFSTIASTFLVAVNEMVADQNVAISAINADLSAALSTISGNADSAAAAEEDAEAARDDAIAARDKANEWASKAEDAVVESGQYSALHYSKKSEQFKNSANAAVSAIQSAPGIPAMPSHAGKNLVVKASETGVEWGYPIPSGVIFMWYGSIETIPDGWYLCDGANGTPDLRGRFVIAAGGTYSPGTTGNGSIPSHTHGAGTLATNSTGEHYHTTNGTATIGIGFYGMEPVASYSPSVPSGSNSNHSHTISGLTASVGSGTDVIAKHYALAYLMKG